VVSKDGSLPRYCDATITGFVGFKKRMELSLEGGDQHSKSPNITKGGGKTSVGSFSNSYSPLKAMAPKVPPSLYKA
jgi:hypothetical protein